MADGNLKLKYVGYCMSQLPPEAVELTYADFVNYAKFQLCRKTSRLMKDPIWDKYTDEEILAEHYAHNFASDMDAKVNFEKEYMQSDDSIDDWMIEKSGDLQEFKPEDKISFKPSDLGEK